MSFEGWRNWGVEFVGTAMQPGNSGNQPWLQLGPFPPVRDPDR